MLLVKMWIVPNINTTSHDLKIALCKNKKEKGVLRKTLNVRLQSRSPALPVSGQWCTTRSPHCPLLSACRALPHRVPSFGYVLQGVGNSLPPENWQRLVPLWAELFSLFWLALGLPTSSPGHNHRDCCLVKATWRDAPDLVLPRPCSKLSQLIDLGSLKRG